MRARWRRGLQAKVPLGEPVAGPVPPDVMDAHLAPVDPDERA